MKLNWLKFDTEFFNDHKIKKIRKLPAGDQIVLCWVAVLCLAMKSIRPGFLIISDTIPVNEEDLALEADVSIETAKIAFITFEKMGMIFKTEGGIIAVKKFAEHQDLESIALAKEKERERKRKYRENQRLMTEQLRLGNVPPVPRDSTGTDANKNESKNKEKEREEGVSDETRHNAPEQPSGHSNDPEHEQGHENSLQPAKTPASPPLNMLWEELYQLRKLNRTLPASYVVNGKRKSSKDHKQLFSPEAKSMCAAYEQEDGLQFAIGVFIWASKDNFWGKNPIVPEKYLSYKTAMMKEQENPSGNGFKRTTSVVDEVKRFQERMGVANE